MAYYERMRDVISEPFSPEVIQQRRAAGWQMVSIEWRRELPDAETPHEGAFAEEIPYGLRVSDDCRRLEVEPREHQALMLMMELLVQDFSYSSIVSDLNEKGFRQRDDRPWSRVAVFNMMPRLIEVGPRMFSSDEWEKRRIGIDRRAAAQDPER
jgi:Recombinase